MNRPTVCVSLVRRLFPLAAVGLGLAACDGGFFVEPALAPEPDASLALMLATGDGADASPNAALLDAADQLRVQVLRTNSVVLDTLLAFHAATGPVELVLPLGSATVPATVHLEVELRSGRQAVLRGNRSVQLNRRQFTTVEVELVPAGSTALAPVAQISAGVFHSCAVKTDRRAYCWGDNRFGQLGDGMAGVRLTPVRVGGDLVFQQVHAGYVSSCGLDTDQRAHCWGENQRGALGIGEAARSAVPAPVATPLRFASLTVGGLHACGLTADGRAWCWGYNEHGQLGDGSVADSRVPVAAAPALRFRSLSAGHLHTCGVATDDRAWCWGYNEYGQLGNGSTVDRTDPAAVAGALPLRTVSAGALHTCGVTADGRAWCWGYNRSGQLGDGTPRTMHSVPVPVAGATRFRSVVAGGAHSCGIDEASGVLCWGHNRSGSLGTGTFEGANIPDAVVGGVTAHLLGVGLHHTCAVTPESSALCWGYNAFGQLGDRSTVRAAEPGAVYEDDMPPVGLQSGSGEVLEILRMLLGRSP